MLVEKIPEAGSIVDVGDGNKIITSSDSVLVNSKINFKGRNNILKMGGRCHLINSLINLNGNESVVLLSSNRHDYYLNVSINHSSVFYMGNDNYINGRLTAICSEQKHIFFGSESVISFGIWVRTADPHLVYDANSKDRINPSKSIFVGDHVWLGQSALLLKGTHIGSGSIIGAGSVVAGKIIPSNTSWAGNPVRKIRDNIFWSGQCVHRWRDEETQYYQKLTTDAYIFGENKLNTYSLDVLDERITLCTTAVDKLKCLDEIVRDKDRFYI